MKAQPIDKFEIIRELGACVLALRPTLGSAPPLASVEARLHALRDRVIATTEAQLQEGGSNVDLAAAQERLAELLDDLEGAVDTTLLPDVRARIMAHLGATVLQAARFGVCILDGSGDPIATAEGRAGYVATPSSIGTQPAMPAADGSGHGDSVPDAPAPRTHEPARASARDAGADPVQPPAVADPVGKGPRGPMIESAMHALRWVAKVARTSNLERDRGRALAELTARNWPAAVVHLRDFAEECDDLADTSRTIANLLDGAPSEEEVPF